MCLYFHTFGVYFNDMQFFTPDVVFIGTCAGFIFGGLWFSPVLFMNAWLKGQGLTKHDMPKRSMTYMVQINVYSFTAHGAIASVIALLFDLLDISSLKVASALGALLAIGFVVTTRYIDMLYTTDGVHFGMKSQVKFLVNAGYYICVMTVMSVVMFLVK